ncbi:hypothetical protein HD806DRAFT_508227 [Xylariaceae sp. AK1471]|nr:hypothetical protein HD806DRAFT_508227 [Xylariaceae sp. AK1471]
MRFQPFTSPTPPVNGLSSTWVSSTSRGRADITTNDAVLLPDSDPETNQLLPRRQRQHRVRIQGRLAIVRTASMANLGQARNSSPTAQSDLNCEDARGSLFRRRGSYDDSEAGEDDSDSVAERDAQFRGYGIGGAGNIRRPTDIMGASSSASPSLLSLSRISSSPPTVSLNTTKPDKLRRRVASLLRGLRGQQREK